MKSGRPPKFGIDAVKQFKSMFLAGFTVKQIAERFGVQPITVKRYLAK